MIRKIFPIILAFLLAVFIVTPALADKSYHAEHFDVNLELRSGGTMLVTETVEFRFDGGPFTYAFREVSKTGTDGVTFLDANMDGVPMLPGSSAGQVEIQDGDPLKITWHFAPTSDATHVFVIRYRVEGAIRTGAADTLIWRAIPEEHEYPIAKSTITLEYPTGVRTQNAPTLDRTFDSASTDSGIKLVASDIGENDSLTLTANFQSGNLVQSAPLWQARQEQDNVAAKQALLISLFAGLATLLLGGLGLFAYLRANQRNLNLPVPNLRASPPDNLAPALVAKLTGMSNASMGTLFDLAQRGLFEVREQSGFLGTKNYILMTTRAQVSLMPHEQGLLDAIFKPGETQANLTEIPIKLAGKSHLIDKPLEAELIQRGWLDEGRVKTRSGLIVTSLLTLFGSMVLFLLGVIGLGISQNDNSLLMMLTAGLAGVGGGAFVLSIPMLIYTGTFSTLTPSGEEEKVHWDGFRTYLTQVSQGKEAAISPDTFERYLAFATIFGLGTEWAKSFQQLGGVSLPVWFHALADSDGDFGAMVAVMSASDSAAYSSGADGGGGASGGGASGAG